MNQVSDDVFLRQLIADTCRHPRRSLPWRQGLGQIIQAVLASKKLWHEQTPYYGDALQDTWMYLSQNLKKYDPDRASPTTWLNVYLRWRLNDYRKQLIQEQHRQVHAKSAEDGQAIDLIATLPAPPDIPPILEAVRDWAKTDPDGSLRQTHLRNRPDISCQILILRRLPPETRWKDLAIEFSCSVGTLANFYQRQCVPRLDEFGKTQGYL